MSDGNPDKLSPRNELVIIMGSVGIVIPAYRPDPTLLADYITTLNKRLSPAAIRIELDGSVSHINHVLADLPETVTANTVDSRRGKGAAVTDGFEALIANDAIDILAFVDADGSTHAESVADLLNPILETDADVSVGSRRHPDATIASHQTIMRRRLGDGFAWLARRLLDVQLYDYQCGAKAVTREAWRKIRTHLHESGFAWDFEFISTANALEYQVVEVPVRWEDRPKSTVSPMKTALHLARSLIISRHQSRALRGSHVHRLLNDIRSKPQALVERERANGENNIEER